MKRALMWINLMGAAALAVLCVVQWQRDRRLNLEINRLEKEHYAQQARISEQEKTAKGLQADLARFKEQFNTAHSSANEARNTLRTRENENAQLLHERDQLKASVTNWVEAVSTRDERLREVNERMRDIAARLNDSVVKYNELTTNYNASIKRFNDLATNYNSVVNQLNESRGKENSSRK